MKTNQRGMNKRIAWQERVLPLREDIKTLYVEGDLSQRDCAGIFGVSQAMFGRWVKMLDMPTKSKARSGEKNGRFIDGSETRPYLKLIVRRECQECGTKDSLLVHHKDGDHTNNALDNLRVMCRSCHFSYHKKLYWAKKRECHNVAS